MRSLKAQVEYCLKEYPDTRNSDIALMIKIWEQFYPKLIKKGSTGETGVWLKDLYELPREDNIKRHRAVFQNVLFKYLPTSLEVVKQRKINEEKWLEYIRNESEHKRI